MSTSESLHLERPACIQEALDRLGIRRFVLGAFASAFPAGPADTGYGSPYGRAARGLFELAARLGFNGVHLGPQGLISSVNPSPYDGMAFSRNVLSIDVESLANPEWCLLSLDDVDRATRQVHGTPDRARANLARPVIEDALHTAYARFRELDMDDPLRRQFVSWRKDEEDWLERDAVYDALVEYVGDDDPERLDPLARALFHEGPDAAGRRRAARAAFSERAGRYELAQFVVHRQHELLRSRLSGRLLLYGDLPVGSSHRDRFVYRNAFLADCVMGAPPSRTNPDGQPWGYPVFDPRQLDDEYSPARLFFDRRLRKLFEHYDGVRVDHPHGLVCPWVYHAGSEDPLRAVQEGARLYESPDLPDHPSLARFAIARRDNLTADPSVRRWADDWVVQLDDEQVQRYGRLVRALLGAAREHDCDTGSVAWEVLSTCPYPLRRVLERHGLGRFRVTQKANLADPSDVYRSENACKNDWIMVGTHDTPSLYTAARRWAADDGGAARAAYLAERLAPDPDARAALRSSLCSVSALSTASLADLFVSRAENVYVFFADLFGETEPFNRAGVVHPENWTLRIPPSCEAVLASRIDAGEALDVPRALALALRALRAPSELVAAVEAVRIRPAVS